MKLRRGSINIRQPWIERQIAASRCAEMKSLEKDGPAHAAYPLDVAMSRRKWASLIVTTVVAPVPAYARAEGSPMTERSRMLFCGSSIGIAMIFTPTS